MNALKCLITGSYQTADASNGAFLNIGNKTIDGSCMNQSSECVIDMNCTNIAHHLQRTQKLKKRAGCGAV